MNLINCRPSGRCGQRRAVQPHCGACAGHLRGWCIRHRRAENIHHCRDCNLSYIRRSFFQIFAKGERWTNKKKFFFLVCFVYISSSYLITTFLDCPHSDPKVRVRGGWRAARDLFAGSRKNFFFEKKNFLKAFEIFAFRCTAELSPFVPKIVQITNKLLSFDPNYNYGPDDEATDEMEMGKKRKKFSKWMFWR